MEPQTTRQSSSSSQRGEQLEACVREQVEQFNANPLGGGDHCVIRTVQIGASGLRGCSHRQAQRPRQAPAAQLNQRDYHRTPAADTRVGGTARQSGLAVVEAADARGRRKAPAVRRAWAGVGRL
jgi:hypothetical protein